MRKISSRRVPHRLPPYSSDMSPCDFDFFPQLKEPLRGHRFPDVTSALRALRRPLLSSTNNTLSVVSYGFPTFGKRWSDLWIEDLVSISHSSDSSSMEPMEVSETIQRDSKPNHASTSSETVYFNNVRLMVSGALFSPNNHTT
ncbi:hypothetical protein AVEN_115020-1 [Araneus ventricosus]|uniref:Uncharacterized protein n=1 Tax=Araneus ventricosus TaxID=182803 RepID=A0A4Y1ZX60_ARAVE|nr:hypothetical protein AVEN_115020-1 [Araneus ventricosus]